MILRHQQKQANHVLVILNFTSFISLTNLFSVSGQQLPLVQYFTKKGERRVKMGREGGGGQDHYDIKAIGKQTRTSNKRTSKVFNGLQK